MDLLLKNQEFTELSDAQLETINGGQSGSAADAIIQNEIMRKVFESAVKDAVMAGAMAGGAGKG